MNVSKFAPTGTTHILPQGGVMKAGGNQRIYLQWVRCEGNRIYIYETDGDNEYPQWVEAARVYKDVDALRSLITPL